jgi:hypothetical protein
MSYRMLSYRVLWSSSRFIISCCILSNRIASYCVVLCCMSLESFHHIVLLCHVVLTVFHHIVLYWTMSFRRIVLYRIVLSRMVLKPSSRFIISYCIILNLIVLVHQSSYPPYPTSWYVMCWFPLFLLMFYLSNVHNYFPYYWYEVKTSL